MPAAKSGSPNAPDGLPGESHSGGPVEPSTSEQATIEVASSHPRPWEVLAAQALGRTPLKDAPPTSLDEEISESSAGLLHAAVQESTVRPTLDEVPREPSVQASAPQAPSASFTPEVPTGSIKETQKWFAKQPPGETNLDRLKKITAAALEGGIGRQSAPDFQEMNNPAVIASIPQVEIRNTPPPAKPPSSPPEAVAAKEEGAEPPVSTPDHALTPIPPTINDPGLEGSVILSQSLKLVASSGAEPEAPPDGVLAKTLRVAPAGAADQGPRGTVKMKVDPQPGAPAAHGPTGTVRMRAGDWKRKSNAKLTSKLIAATVLVLAAAVFVIYKIATMP